MLELLFLSFSFVVCLNWFLMMNFLAIMFLISIMFICEDSLYMLSLIMIMLSIWLIMMMMMSVGNSDKSMLLLSVFIFILICLQICFFSESLFLFYFGFEMSILPVLVVIFGWGYQPDRVEAGIYMICYTVVFSLPFLISIFFLDACLEFKENFIISFLILIGFLVKLPMFGIHLWLPRAHVEAPVYGSMILAGVMLKLGGYGIMKISFIMGDLFFSVLEFLIIYSLMGGIYMSLICFIQSDMKMLIAYSSIVHMSIVLSGLLTMKEEGYYGSLMMMIAHGMCSSGLFCILGFNYSRSHSRSMFVNKGYMKLMPICSLWWFLFCSSNLSFPPSLNLPGEMLLFISLIMWSSSMLILIATLSFFSSMYSIYLFSFSQHGEGVLFYSFKTFSVHELLTLLLHWVPLNLLVLDLMLY